MRQKIHNWWLKIIQTQEQKKLLEYMKLKWEFNGSVLRCSLANIGIHKKYCFHLSHLSRCDCLVGLSCLLQKNTMLKNNIYLQSVIADVDNWWEMRKTSTNTSFRNKCCLAHGRRQCFHILFIPLYAYLCIHIYTTFHIAFCVYIYRSEMPCTKAQNKIKMP